MRINRISAAIALCLLFGTAAVAQLASDMKLEDAGFVMRRADTPEKLRQAKALPPRKFVGRVKNGKTYYVYADPELCHCVFVGSALSLQTYRDMRKLRQPDVVMPSGANAEAEVIDDLGDDRWNLIGPDSYLDYDF